MTSPAARPSLAVRNVTRGIVLAVDTRTGSSLWDKFRGLMLRPSLRPGEALWLPGENGIHMFFMRFPIDAVFLGRRDADGAYPVVAVHARLRPWRGIVWWARGAHGVLELAAGIADATGTRTGDRLAFEDRGPQPAAKGA